MSGHTRKGWAVEPDGGNLMVSTDLLEICTIQPVDRGGAKSFYVGNETIANARLIAAAPDLLEALEVLFADYKQLADSGDAGFWKLEDTDEGKQAMAALAKARGEK